MPDALCPICRNSDRVKVLRLTSKGGLISAYGDAAVADISGELNPGRHLVK